MGEEKPKPIGVWTTVKPFVNGGASGMLATCVIQPIDMIKAIIFLFFYFFFLKFLAFSLLGHLKVVQFWVMSRPFGGFVVFGEMGFL